MAEYPFWGNLQKWIKINLSKMILLHYILAVRNVHVMKETCVMILYTSVSVHLGVELN